MNIQQLSVFVENRPGVLAAITALLGDACIDIQALSMADTTEFGVLRLIVNQVDKAYETLAAAGYPVSRTNVLAVCIGHQPGGLARALAALGEAVTVEYCYAFMSRDPRRAFVILRLDRNEEGAALLQKAGFSVLSADEL